MGGGSGTPAGRDANTSTRWMVAAPLHSIIIHAPCLRYRNNTLKMKQRVLC